MAAQICRAKLQLFALSELRAFSKLLLKSFLCFPQGSCITQRLQIILLNWLAR